MIVLDSVGCGKAPDASAYGDEGADTLGHLFGQVPGVELPHLASLGLDELLHDRPQVPKLPGAQAARLTATSAGKDTTTGHWELMGHSLAEPFAVFKSFPADLIDELTRRAGTGFIGNHAASGTEIIDRLGNEHVRTKKPILYTSADSVMQFAAHEGHFGLQRLWDLCLTARQLLDERGIRIGRVIARPFGTVANGRFERTSNRRDFSIVPGETALNRLLASGVHTIGIGKIFDIFAGSGIAESHPTKSNAEGMRAIESLWATCRDKPRFLLANLVDFDSLYGHRRNPAGYATCLREFDAWLGSFLPAVDPAKDLLLITADHGNDPYHPGTDHTREQVPLLAYGLRETLRNGVFSDAARIVEAAFPDATLADPGRVS